MGVLMNKLFSFITFVISLTIVYGCSSVNSNQPIIYPPMTLVSTQSVMPSPAPSSQPKDLDTISPTNIPTQQTDPKILTSPTISFENSSASQPLDEITQQGVTTSLTWVYADQTRIAFEYRIKGKLVPDGYQLYCPVSKVTLSNDAGKSYYRYQWESQNPTLDEDTFYCQAIVNGEEYLITQTYLQDTPSSTKSINLTASINLGGFISHKGSGESVQIPDYPPFVFHFSIPIQSGLTREINLEKNNQGVSVNFQRIELNHSISYLYYCVNYPNHKQWQMDLTLGWNDQTITNGVYERLGLDRNKMLGYDQVLVDKRCYRVPFVFIYDGKVNSDLSRSINVSFKSLSINSLDPPTQEDCAVTRKKIQRENPDINFDCLIQPQGQIGYNFSLQITHKPNSVDDTSAQRLVEQAFLSVIPVDLSTEVLVP